MPSVRGIGVAVSVSTSTSARSAFFALLVAHAEAVLLVDDQQAEVLELHVGGQQLVRADHDVDGAVGNAFHRRLHLPWPSGKRDSSATFTGQLPKRSAKFW